METRMTGRKLVKMSMVGHFAQQKNTDIDWVTIGVLVNKSPPKTSKNSGRSEVCLSIDHPGKVMLMGTSKDFGTCRGKTRDGQSCNNVVNLATCPFCVYHVKAEYRKMSSKRTDLQASYSGVAPSGLKQKILKKNEVIYGGRMFSNPTREATKTLRTKDKLTLTNLKVAREAAEIEKTSRQAAAAAIQLKHLSSTENQAINAVAAKSDFLGKALCNPGAGSRNFLRHVVKESDPAPGPSAKREMISVTAKDLLRMQSRSMKSLTTSPLNAPTKPASAPPKPPSGSSLTPAPLPRLTALTPSEIAKLRAAQKLKSKAPLVPQDPNAVKKDTASPVVQEKIQRRLEEPLTSSIKECRGDETAEMPAAKKSRLGPALTEEQVEKLLRQKSSHAHQVDDVRAPTNFMNEQNENSSKMQIKI
ncbi:hypothetical protein HPB48_013576 [Haemaphysalis longicornis]|uniref:Protein MCM10 homolog n=1 Tax=Haemaphysalis longicornis TaxID=44386 RepID=A0A9J6H593_HAELO|nr:hypothetical protein HPB48_013576 [Haemaphysalis longicornis]